MAESSGTDLMGLAGFRINCWSNEWYHIIYCSLLLWIQSHYSYHQLFHKTEADSKPCWVPICLSTLKQSSIFRQWTAPGSHSATLLSTENLENKFMYSASKIYCHFKINICSQNIKQINFCWSVGQVNCKPEFNVILV